MDSRRFDSSNLQLIGRRRDQSRDVDCQIQVSFVDTRNVHEWTVSVRISALCNLPGL